MAIVTRSPSRMPIVFRDLAQRSMLRTSSLYVVDFFAGQKYLVSGRVLDGVISAVQEALEKVS